MSATAKPDPYAVYAVEQFCRTTRRTLATLGTRMTMDNASALAREYRETDAAAENAAELEARHGYRLATIPLEDQAEVLAGPVPASVDPKDAAAGAPTDRAAGDRPPAVRAGSAARLVATIDALTAERDREAERDHNLRIALRLWAQEVYGTVDDFARTVADRAGCTVTFARECLYREKSRRVFDLAVEVYRERAGAPEAVPA